MLLHFGCNCKIVISGPTEEVVIQFSIELCNNNNHYIKIHDVMCRDDSIFQRFVCNINVRSNNYEWHANNLVTVCRENRVFIGALIIIISLKYATGALSLIL